MNENSISIELNRQHAIVLCSFLARFTDKDKLEIEDQAEQRALWDLYALLESTLPEIFDNRWESIVQMARDSIRDPAS